MIYFYYYYIFLIESLSNCMLQDEDSDVIPDYHAGWDWLGFCQTHLQ